MKYLKLKVFGSSLLATVILASCTTATTPETESAVPSSSVVESSVSETTTETSEETSETSFTVETEEKNNPLSDYAIQDPNGYSSSAYAIISPIDSQIDIGYGFDNPYTIQELRECIQTAT